MPEYVPKLLNFGQIGSSITIAAGMLLITTYFLTKLISNKPKSWMLNMGIHLIIDGATFYTMFLALKIIATNIGLI